MHFSKYTVCIVAFLMSTLAHAQFGDLLKEVAKGATAGTVLEELTKIKSKSDDTSSSDITKGDMDSLVIKLESLSPLLSTEGKKKKQIKKDKKTFTLEVYRATIAGYEGLIEDLSIGIFGSVCARPAGGGESKCDPNRNFDGAVKLHKSYLSKAKTENNAAIAKERLLAKYPIVVLNSLAYIWGIDDKIKWDNASDTQEDKVLERLDKLNPNMSLGKTEGAEFYSDEYAARIEKRIKDIDESSDGFLSLLQDFWGELPEKSKLAHSAITKDTALRTKSFCDDIFDDQTLAFYEDLSSHYKKPTDACEPENFVRIMLLDPFSLEPDKLRNVSPPAYGSMFQLMSFKPDYVTEYEYKRIYKYTLKDNEEAAYGNLERVVKFILNRASIDAVFYAGYGLETGFDITKYKNDLVQTAKRFYFQDISSKSDIEDRVASNNYLSRHFSILMTLASPESKKETTMLEFFKDFTSEEAIELRADTAKEVESFKEFQNLWSAFDILEACYEARQDYASVYITTRKIREIRSHYKTRKAYFINRVQYLREIEENGTLDQVLKKASTNEFIGRTMGEMIRLGGGSWNQETKDECDLYSFGFFEF